MAVALHMRCPVYYMAFALASLVAERAQGDDDARLPAQQSPTVLGGAHEVE